MAVNGWRRPWSAQPFGDASASPLWIARKLVGAWGFDGSLPGRNIADSPGLGDLTGSNATRTGSPYGAATALNGSSAYLTNTANSAVTQLPVTFFARVYIGATKQARIFDISTGTTANDVIGLQQNNTELRAQHYDGGGEGYAGINNAGNIGRWITVAGVFDGLASRAIYVDGGDQVATNATALSAPSGINRVTIGYAPWGSSEYFNGTVSHALLFASALTAAEIKALHLDTLQVLAPRRIWLPVSAGGSTLTATPIEATAGTDLASASAVLSASLLDAAAGTDITSAQPTVARSLVDAAGGVDLVNAGAVVNGTLVEGVSAVDLSSALATLSVTVNEAVTAAELLAATRIANVAATEAAAGVDISTTGTSLSGSLVDAVVSADALSAAATLVASVLEAGGVVDQIHAAAQLVVLLTESAAGSDVVSRPAVYSVSALELVAALDVLSAAIGAAGLDPSERYTIAAKARRLTITAAARRLEIRK